MYDLFAPVHRDVSCTRQRFIVFCCVPSIHQHNASHIQEAVSNSLINEWVGTDSKGFRVNTCDTEQTCLKIGAQCCGNLEELTLRKSGGLHNLDALAFGL